LFSRVTDRRVERWLDALLATPGLTAIRDPEEARRVHLDDSLSALELVRSFEGPIVDVGSGGGSPGIPLAAALPNRDVTLLEATGWKCDFLREMAQNFPNVSVVHGRAEEQKNDRFGVAVAKALAPPAVAAEWCLSLVAPGGAAILYTGDANGGLAAVAEAIAAAPPEVHEVEGAERRRLVVLRKLGPTPAGFPRRPGMARKRPLA
jgi:16S rRNA (guanine527-N7)-methyltransferase